MLIFNSFPFHLPTSPNDILFCLSSNHSPYTQFQCWCPTVISSVCNSLGFHDIMPTWSLIFLWPLPFSLSLRVLIFFPLQYWCYTELYHFYIFGSVSIMRSIISFPNFSYIYTPRCTLDPYNLLCLIIKIVNTNLYLVCARHHSKYIIYINLFEPHNRPMMRDNTHSYKRRH